MINIYKDKQILYTDFFTHGNVLPYITFFTQFKSIWNFKVDNYSVSYQ